MFTFRKFWFSTNDMLLSDELPKSPEGKVSPSPTYLLLGATFHGQPFSLSVSVVLFLHHGLPAPKQVNNTEPESKYSLLVLNPENKFDSKCLIFLFQIISLFFSFKWLIILFRWEFSSTQNPSHLFYCPNLIKQTGHPSTVRQKGHNLRVFYESCNWFALRFSSILRNNCLVPFMHIIFNFLMQCIKAKLNKLHDTVEFLCSDLLCACYWKQKAPV